MKVFEDMMDWENMRYRRNASGGNKKGGRSLPDGSCDEESESYTEIETDLIAECLFKEVHR